MNDKIELMKRAFNRICDNESFMAFYLKSYAGFEKLTYEQIQLELHCSEEDFYKLALCKAPSTINLKSREILQYISEYTNLDSLAIRKIISQVNNIHHYQNLQNQNLMMAARDRTTKNQP